MPERKIRSCAKSLVVAERKTPTCAGWRPALERKTRSCEDHHPVLERKIRSCDCLGYRPERKSPSCAEPEPADGVTSRGFPFRHRSQPRTTPAFSFRLRPRPRTTRQKAFHQLDVVRTTPAFPFRRPGHPSQLGLFLSGALARASDQAVCAYRHHDDGHHAEPHYITQSLTIDSGEIQGRSPMIGAIRVGCRPCTRRAI